MCLYIDKKFHPERKPQPLIASKDIHVVKSIEPKSNKAMFRNFYYKPNTLYNGAGSRSIIDGNEIHAGYIHAYSSLKHKDSAFYLDDYYNHRYYKTVAFVIPKGTRYFVGTGLDVAAETMVSGDLVALGKDALTDDKYNGKLFSLLIEKDKTMKMNAIKSGIKNAVKNVKNAVKSVASSDETRYYVYSINNPSKVLKNAPNREAARAFKRKAGTYRIFDRVNGETIS